MGGHNKIVFDENRVVELYCSGLSVDMVSEAIGVGRDSIYKRFRKLKVKMRPHSESMTGKPAPNYKGWYMSRGYKVVHLEKSDPLYCMTDKYGVIREHRIVMARHLGRPLTDKDVVHHINEIQSDNRIENLSLETATSHAKKHLMERNPSQLGRKGGIIWGRMRRERKRAIVAASEAKEKR